MTHKCSQCDKPAMWQLEDNYLCLDCYSRFVQINHLQFSQLASLANQAIDDIENIMGLSSGGRLHIPSLPPTINTGQTTYNNIRVDNSVVGAINTGNIKKLDIMMNAIRGENNPELADALQKLTQAILDTPDLEPSDKDSVLEYLSFLSKEALTQETERQFTIGMAAISTLEKILSNVGSIASIWSVAKPLLEALFN